VPVTGKQHIHLAVHGVAAGLDQTVVQRVAIIHIMPNDRAGHRALGGAVAGFSQGGAQGGAAALAVPCVLRNGGRIVGAQNVDNNGVARRGAVTQG